MPVNDPEKICRYPFCMFSPSLVDKSAIRIIGLPGRGSIHEVYAVIFLTCCFADVLLDF